MELGGSSLMSRVSLDGYGGCLEEVGADIYIGEIINLEPLDQTDLKQ
jgi:hypothetical protein